MEGIQGSVGIGWRRPIEVLGGIHHVIGGCRPCGGRGTGAADPQGTRAHCGDLESGDRAIHIGFVGLGEQFGQVDFDRGVFRSGVHSARQNREGGDVVDRGDSERVGGTAGLRTIAGAAGIRIGDAVGDGARCRCARGIVVAAIGEPHGTQHRLVVADRRGARQAECSRCGVQGGGDTPEQAAAGDRQRVTAAEAAADLHLR